MKRFTYFLSILFFASGIFAANASVISNASGNWGTASTWLRNGVAAVPVAGDTVFIRSFDVVTVNAQTTYTGSPLKITVAGTLQFTNGNKLDLPCNSYVNIISGGIIKKSTPGGGNSTLISICGSTLWNAGMGQLDGPVYLPVLLLNFNAFVKGKQVEISWITGSEINNDYFIVQKSSDNFNYTDLDKVTGSGNTTQKSFYSTVDKEPVTGYNYYRLCQFDYDGKKHYYPAVIAVVNGKSNLVVYPNPATTENISVLYDGIKETDCDVEVKDISGKTILKKEHLLIQPGSNKLLMNDLVPFSTGTYFITIYSGDKVYDQKIFISNSN